MGCEMGNPSRILSVSHSGPPWATIPVAKVPLREKVGFAASEGAWGGSSFSSEPSWSASFAHSPRAWLVFSVFGGPKMSLRRRPTEASSWLISPCSHPKVSIAGFSFLKSYGGSAAEAGWRISSRSFMSISTRWDSDPAGAPSTKIQFEPSQIESGSQYPRPECSGPSLSV